MSAKQELVKEINLIGSGTTVEGKIRCQGSMRVDGKIVGDVSIGESIAVGVSGEIEGNVTSKNATIGGKIRGSIIAAEKIVFEEKSVVKGDVRAARLVIDEGCVFDGKVAMSDRSHSTDQKH